MSTGQFRPGDKVFAKVRGYPPWPAIISGYADETPSKLKFNVYFYGTKETAVCKPDELYDYIKYREKFNKPIKRRFFAEGMKELELELEEKDRNPELFQDGKSQGETQEKKKEGENDTSVVIDEAGPAKKTKVDGANVVKRKSSSAVSETAGNLETPESEGSKTNSEVVSRSGRKIKPKKFLDDAASAEASTSASTSGSARHTPKQKLPGKDDSGENSVAELTFNTSQDPANMLSVVQQTGLPEPVRDKLATAIENSVGGRPTNPRLEPLKVEVQLLDCNCRIKSSLNLVNANCVDCLNAMEDLLQLNLTALMLKKHPEVLDTVRKLKNYVGNLSKWNFTEIQEKQFKENAAKIREKAGEIYNKMRLLFDVEEGGTFRTAFEEEVRKFRELTVNMDQNQIYALISEPEAVNGH